MLYYFLFVIIKVWIVDEFDEGDRFVLIVVMFGFEFFLGVVGDVFVIVWSDVWVK